MRHDLATGSQSYSHPCARSTMLHWEMIQSCVYVWWQPPCGIEVRKIATFCSSEAISYMVNILGYVCGVGAFTGLS